VGFSSVDCWQQRCVASAVVMLDTPCSEVVWRVLATHCIRQFPLHFPSCASPSAITFQLESVPGKIILFYSSWNVMAHGDALMWKWRGNWRMEWVASTLHTTSEHGVSSITTADAAHLCCQQSTELTPTGRFKCTRPVSHERRNLVSPRVPSHFNWPLPT